MFFPHENFSRHVVIEMQEISEVRYPEHIHYMK